jgi:multiple sugar transport system ATP-binding protein
MARVELESVRKSYEDESGKGPPVEVVKGVDLDIEDGEFLVLVGPSGCGKSTTMRMVAGLEEITEGEIRIGDKRVNEVQPKDRDIGMVFQSYALYPHMTVYDNLSFGLKIRKVSKSEIDKRVKEVSEMLDIASYLDRRPAALSGGQRQRVAMGRAIARNPRVFLFDEPLSNLDSALRVRMRAELSRLHARLKTTTIYVTHDQVEAMTLASRIAVLHQGILQQVGPPADLFHRPANTFVAQFIGSPSMNLLSGVELSGGRLKAEGIDLEAPAGVSEKVAHVGFRPHDVSVVDEGGSLSGEIAAVERMGWEAFAHVDTGAGSIVARVEGPRAETIDAGESVHLAVATDALHLFDGEGARL